MSLLCHRFLSRSNNVCESKIIAYQSLTIAYGSLGSETFQFDINSAMAVSKVTDFSGNVTTFAHTDAWSAPQAYSLIIAGAPLNGFYDDPTSQLNAIGNATGNPTGNTKTFTYYHGNRIMQTGHRRKWQSNLL